MFAASLAVALLDTVIPLFIGRLVTLMEATDRQAALAQQWPMLAGMIGLVLIVRPIAILVDMAIRQSALIPGATTLIRWQSHWHVIRQSWPFFQNDFAGRIANRVMQTANALRESTMASIRAVWYIVVYGSSAFALMALADWRLGLPTLCWFAGYVLFLRHFVPKLRDLAKTSSECRSLVMARVVDSYTNILTVKLFARLADEDAYVRESLDQHQDGDGRAHAADHTLHDRAHRDERATPRRHVRDRDYALGPGRGQRGRGRHGAAARLADRQRRRLGKLGSDRYLREYRHGAGGHAVDRRAARRGRSSRMRAHLRYRAARSASRTSASAMAEPMRRRCSLNWISTIRPGERVGLVGRSGAGKSTFVNLLLRFYDPEQGRILIDGQDIALVTEESLRAAIGMVTQDTSLLHRSIAGNIRYGRPTASDEQIMAAARRAHAHDFIIGLRDWNDRTGYDAHVGERGVKLSGGQRQRIALARVILKDAPILVLDEATSSLDSEVEAAIQEQLQSLMEGKTVIAIAHRLSTIARMDRLIVLDAGRIVEQGTHAELLVLRGHYEKLWQHQSGGFLAERRDHRAVDDEERRAGSYLCPIRSTTWFRVRRRTRFDRLTASAYVKGVLFGKSLLAISDKSIPLGSGKRSDALCVWDCLIRASFFVSLNK